MLLTDEEITLIVRECARGSAIKRDGSTSHRIARAVIASYEAKLREQEPMAFYDGNKFYANEESAICGCADMTKLKPVFLNPAPIPEGWRPIDGECNHVGTVVTLHQSGDVRVSHSNWVGKDMCKPYNRPAMPAYMSTIDDGWTHWMPIPAMAVVRSGE